jgi:HlyD family secretion protein
MTIWVLAGFMVTALLLTFVTRIDRMVTSQGGKIVPVGQVNVFQSLDPAIIKSINVREGDKVQKGQLLATLDPTFAVADANQTKQLMASLEAQVIREQSELDGRPLSFPHRSDPEFKVYADLQKALYDQRMAQYAAQVAGFDAKMSQTRASIQRLQRDDERYTQREEIAQKIEDMRSSLAASGSGSRLNLYLSQDTRLELLRSIDNTHNSLLEAKHTLESIEADKHAFIEQWKAQLSQDLVTSKNKLDDARASYEKALKHQDLVRLNAIEPSVVLTIARLSVGSVLKQGDPFITLMPLDSPLEAEIKIASRDVGFIRPGDRCVLSVDAFNAAEHGTAEGSVRWISGGAFTADDDGKPVDAYYKARCSIDQTHFVGVPENFGLIPGMTLSGNINVGKRSVAMYLLSGIMRGISTSMREP